MFFNTSVTIDNIRTRQRQWLDIVYVLRRRVQVAKSVKAPSPAPKTPQKPPQKPPVVLVPAAQVRQGHNPFIAPATQHGKAAAPPKAMPSKALGGARQCHVGATLRSVVTTPRGCHFRALPAPRYVAPRYVAPR